MRLAYVTETYPPELNGVSLTAARAVEHLRKCGHAVTLVRPTQRGDAADVPADECRTSGCPIPMYPELRFGLSLAAPLQRRWHRDRVELVHVATQGPLGWAAVAAARRSGLPVTADFRTNFHQYTRYYGLGWTRPVVQAYLREFHERAWLTFVPTQETRRELAAAGFRRLHVIGRGVDAACFAPDWRSEALRRVWGVVGEDPVLLYVGRLAAEKNVTLALRAYRAVRLDCPGARMVVVGDGPLRPLLSRRYPDIHFAGALRGAALSRHYASADVFLFPSLSDTFGNVTLEALASALPVVAFATAAAAEHVRPGRSGLLVDRDRPDLFVKAVCALVGQPGTLSAMRSHAREAGQRADWPSALAALERQLLAVTHARPTASAQAAAVA